MASLMGKKIVVVGGSSGIGLGVSAAALVRGAELVIVGRSQDKLLAAQHGLRAGSRVKIVAADMTHENEIATAFAGIGTFDHLVSTAGTPPPGSPIADTDADEIRQFIDSKLTGAVLLAKHAVRRLGRGGSMTFTSGINKDKLPVPGGAVVSAIAGSFGYLARAPALEVAPCVHRLTKANCAAAKSSLHCPAMHLSEAPCPASRTSVCAERRKVKAV